MMATTNNITTIKPTRTEPLMPVLLADVVESKRRWPLESMIVVAVVCLLSMFVA